MKTLPNWKLERYLLGELPAGELTDLQAEESANIKMREQIALLKKSNADILVEYPAETMTKKIISFGNWNPRLLSIAAVLLFLLTARVAYVSYIKEDSVSIVNESGERVKGMQTSLEVWRKVGDGAEKLSNGNLAREGDILQMRYIVPEKCYGALLSIDGNKTLTVHLSGDKGKSAEFLPGKPVAIESSYELDNAPEFEIFYLITSNKEFALAPIMQDLLKGKIPKNMQVSQITLKKE